MKTPIKSKEDEEMEVLLTNIKTINRQKVELSRTNAQLEIAIPKRCN